MGESNLEAYKIYRQQIEKETETTNQKIVWNMISQSFLFSSYVMILNSKPPSEDSIQAHLYHYLLWSIPILSLVMAVMIVIALSESLVQMSLLQKRYEKHFQTPEDLPPIEKEGSNQKVSQIVPFILPGLFVILWGSILILSVFWAQRP